MIGENISILRRKAGWSQEVLAEKLGVARQTVAKWENGESAPDIRHCDALSSLLDVSLEELVHADLRTEPASPKGKFIFGTVTVGDNTLEVPADKAKNLIAGGYDGKTVVLGIRPEDVHDEPAFIQANPNSTISAPVRVYELLGAEVFLYFDFAGAQMTARVNPRTTARAGDTVTFALDMDKTHYFDKETQKTITD